MTETLSKQVTHHLLNTDEVSPRKKTNVVPPLHELLHTSILANATFQRVPPPVVQPTRRSCKSFTPNVPSGRTLRALDKRYTSRFIYDRTVRTETHLSSTSTRESQRLRSHDYICIRLSTPHLANYPSSTSKPMSYPPHSHRAPRIVKQQSYSQCESQDLSNLCQLFAPSRLTFRRASPITKPPSSDRVPTLRTERKIYSTRPYFTSPTTSLSPTRNGHRWIEIDQPIEHLAKLTYMTLPIALVDRTFPTTNPTLRAAVPGTVQELCTRTRCALSS